ncbi:peroxiredoxin [Algoriphagus namhaensis]
MSLAIGQKAPDFTLPSTSGEKVTLSKHLKGKPFILYFYPKDFTPGCTAEACEFRDQFEAFRDLDIPVFGVSRDKMESHIQFKKQHRLPFELLSDLDGKVCKAYDALIPLIRMPKRVTYLINEKQEIAAVFSEMFESKGHIQSMLKNLSS